MRTSLLLVFACACGSTASTAAPASAPADPASEGSAAEERAASGVLEIDGLLFAPCALEDCIPDVQTTWAALGVLLADIAAAPRPTAPLTDATRHPWTLDVLTPYMDAVRPRMESMLARISPGSIEADADRGLRASLVTLVTFRRLADYFDAVGAGPPIADRGGCGMTMEVALYRTLEIALEAAEDCVEEAARASVPMHVDGPRCADAAVALRARLALEVDDGVICDPEMPE
jgi:hypothetical protein